MGGGLEAERGGVGDSGMRRALERAGVSKTRQDAPSRLIQHCPKTQIRPIQPLQTHPTNFKCIQNSNPTSNFKTYTYNIHTCAGFVPTENLRFREESLTFKVTETNLAEEEVKKFHCYDYPAMTKTQVRFVCRRACVVCV